MDERTKRTTIAGALNSLTFRKLPDRVSRPLTVFVSLIDPRGVVDFHVALEHADSGEKVFDLGGPLKAHQPSPFSVLDMHVEMPRLEFKQAAVLAPGSRRQRNPEPATFVG